ncbi:MAG: cyclase, partial [Actinomycetota bacterium]|nr:cyclase [Actinomycetota bacterium]
MSTVEKSIEVSLPVRTVYDQWTQFEEFPRFMEGVEQVVQLDDTHLHWVAEIAG